MQTVLVSIIALAILVVFLQEVHTRHEAHDTAVELAINELSKRITSMEQKSGGGAASAPLATQSDAPGAATAAVPTAPAAIPGGGDAGIPGIFPGVPTRKAVAMPSVHTTEEARPQPFF